MPDEKLGVKARAIMLVLMAEGRELSNTEMDELHGLRLDGQDRRRLNDLGLVDSTRLGRAYVHKLTARGLRWCADELTAGRPTAPRQESFGKALYAVLAGIHRHLDHTGTELTASFFRPAGATADGSLEGHIRSTYLKLAKEPGDYVSLTDLRRDLRAEVDQVLLDLNRGRQVILVPDDDQEALTEEDRTAALRIGSQDNHLLAIEQR